MDGCRLFFVRIRDPHIHSSRMILSIVHQFKKGNSQTARKETVKPEPELVLVSLHFGEFYVSTVMCWRLNCGDSMLWGTNLWFE